MKIKQYTIGIFVLLAFVLMAVALPTYADEDTNGDNEVDENTELNGENGAEENGNDEENGVTEGEEEESNGDENGEVGDDENGGSESALGDDQINAVVALLESFNVDDEAIERVKGALKGKAVGRPPHATRTDTSEAGLSPYLPPQASARANQVQTCLQFSRMIRQGATGDDVKELQKFLKDKGYFNYPEITGYFGEITQKAVEDFQAAEGIVSEGTPETTGYGLVGPKTRAVIAKRSCFEFESSEVLTADAEDEEEEEEEEEEDEEEEEEEE